MNPIDRFTRLTLPKGQLQMVLDTDAYNEIDDQFAIVYALRSTDRLKVNAIYAAPFLNERSVSAADGMEKSYHEIHKLLSLMQYPADDSFVLRGATSFLKNRSKPSVSPAALDLVARAMSAQEPLYVVAIGAITNVASAILLEPKIVDKIVVVWMGGHAFHWHDTQEFNLAEDLPAAQIVFDSGVPLVQLSAMGVLSELRTTPAELKAFVQQQSPVAAYLTENVENCFPPHTVGSRVIWDIGAIAFLVNEAFTPNVLVHTPIVTDQGTYSFDHRRHFMKYVYQVDRDAIFQDLFPKLY